MLFPNSDDEHHRKDGLRRVRDIVEIVAIVAAGLWAAWIFVYEDRIVPAQAQPVAQFSASMEKLSEHNGLIAIRLDTKTRNPGTVTDYFLGYIVAVGGQRITLAQKPNPFHMIDYNVVLDKNTNFSPMEWIFSRGSITTQGDPKSGSGLVVQPGEEQATEYIFYVPSGKFDRLRVYIDARYARDEKPRPTQIVQNKGGMPIFLPRTHIGDYQFATYVGALDLNGK